MNSLIKSLINNLIPLTIMSASKNESTCLLGTDSMKANRNCLMTFETSNFKNNWNFSHDMFYFGMLIIWGNCRFQWNSRRKAWFAFMSFPMTVCNSIGSNIFNPGSCIDQYDFSTQRNLEGNGKTIWCRRCHIGISWWQCKTNPCQLFFFTFFLIASKRRKDLSISHIFLKNTTI